MSEESFNRDFDKLKKAFLDAADRELENLRREMLDHPERYSPSGEFEIRLYIISEGDKIKRIEGGISG